MTHVGGSTIGFPTGGPRPAPTGDSAAAWAEIINRMLHAIWTNTDREGNTLDAASRSRIENGLTREATSAPDQFLPLQDAMARSFGYAPTGGDADQADFLVELTEGLIDSLIGGGSSLARNIVTNIRKNVTRTEEQTVTEDITVTGQQDATTQVTQITFIDLPTTEEVLDDFLTGLATHIATLRDLGQIDNATADFALANSNRFLTAYLGAWGRRIDSGEDPDPFRAVGFEGAAELLGERFGGEVTSTTTTVRTEERISETELEELIESTIERLTATTRDGDPQDINETIRSTVENIFREHRTTTTREEFVSIAGTLTTEEIFGRPRLAAVRTFSPLDFLRESFAPVTLLNFAAQEAGRPAEAQIPRRTVPSAPRRLR